MLATAMTLALFGFAVLILAELFRAEGHKMRAAFQGQSWASQHSASVRPVTFRFSPRYLASPPVREKPALRAAA